MPEWCNVAIGNAPRFVRGNGANGWCATGAIPSFRRAYLRSCAEPLFKRSAASSHSGKWCRNAWVAVGALMWPLSINQAATTAG